ncbi:PREDICTED: pentatricopeptide repeat-containing protein At4g33170 [Tarenaya hassleriana]|uniref:pentatricopeptide repeat-containing protein At4g33170 n=1 Tax=Tarenaya hassleriana TaxID=28532 RepID=UPI00053C1B49|nr:PREDICTED: pentatricopeptide repeat-containing protein At4g33170 [Tarenaya hassleriana]
MQANLKTNLCSLSKSRKSLSLWSLSSASLAPSPPPSSPSFSSYPSSSSSSSSSSSQWFFLLRSAISTADLALGKCTHARILAFEENPERFLINNLISMYSKCGSLFYARRLFDKMPERDLVSWNSILAAYAQCSEGCIENVNEGFRIFRGLRQYVVFTSRMTLAPMLKLCLNSGYLWASEAVHGYALKIGLELDEFVSGALLNTYLKFGRIKEGKVLFEEMPSKDLVSWNLMVKAYLDLGLDEEAQLLVSEFRRSGLRPNEATSRLLATLSDDNSDRCRKHLGQARDCSRLFSDDGNSGGGVNISDVISKNKRLSEYLRAGDYSAVLRCFSNMVESNLGCDNVTFILVLSATVGLGNLALGRQVHGMSLKLGLDSMLPVANSLINMYSKLRQISSARTVFHGMSERDLISWNSIIAGCSQNGMEREAVSEFMHLLRSGLAPDQFTLTSVLKASSSLPGSLSLNKQVHVHAVKSNNVSDNYVSTALIDAYSRNGCMAEAEILFGKKGGFDLATWNAMMFSYTQSEDVDKTLKLVSLMHKRGERPDEITLATVVKACGSLFAMEHGKQIHAYAIKSGFDSDLWVSSGILDMYVKCGDIVAAHSVFNGIPMPDDVAWTTMMSGCIENGEEERAFSVYTQMKRSGILPDEFTIATLLKASSCLTALEQGRQIHANAVKMNCAIDPFVATSLVDMYAKCGSIDDAYSLFRRTEARNITAWNAMLVGLAQHGEGKEALELFKLMKSTGIKPDKVTFIGVLSACSHSGMVSEAYGYFRSMQRDYGIKPEIEHYSCLVDALGRAGLVQEAVKVIESMGFEASVSMYRALLAACRVKGDTETGRRVAAKILELEPSDSSAYVLLSNIYAAAAKWDEMKQARTMMKGQRVKKDPGFSWIVLKNEMYLFVVDDRSNPQSELIYEKVKEMIREIKEEGYIPEMEYALADVEEEEKERSLYYHSEKLAVAFGLINTPQSMPLRVIKNLRVCGDCHNAMKYISKVYRREIVLRDANRFHRFKGGVCSCGDYW